MIYIIYDTLLYMIYNEQYAQDLILKFANFRDSLPYSLRFMFKIMGFICGDYFIL